MNKEKYFWLEHVPEFSELSGPYMSNTFEYFRIVKHHGG